MERESVETRNGRITAPGRHPANSVPKDEMTSSPTISLGVERQHSKSDEHHQNGYSQSHQKQCRTPGVEPLFTRQHCATPASIQEEMKKCSDEREKSEVLLRVLEKQKTEANTLSELHRQLNMTQKADELKRLADQTAYSIAVFNRRLQQRRQIPYTFELVNMPQANVNVDLPPNVLEVAEIRAVDYRIPSDCGVTLESYVQLEIAYPSAKKMQKVKTDWIRYLNGVCYNPMPMQFTIDSTSDAYVQLLKLKEQLKATVYYNRGLAKRAGIFGWTYFTISDLLQSANVRLTTNLNAEGGVIPGYLKLHLRQRTSVQGPNFIPRRKPWLRLVVENITTLNSPPTFAEVRQPTQCPVIKAFITNPQDVPVRLTRPSNDILKELEQFLNNPKGLRVKVPVLRSQMDALHEQYKAGKLENHQVSSYIDELKYLLNCYKRGRKDAEGQTDMQLFKQFLKREMLIQNEIDRYSMGSQMENDVQSSTSKTCSESTFGTEPLRALETTPSQTRRAHTYQVINNENQRFQTSDNRLLLGEVITTPNSLEEPLLVRIHRNKRDVRSPHNGKNIRSWGHASKDLPASAILRKGDSHTRSSREPKGSLLVYTNDYS
ncbi:hypothetical protein CSKR_106210 [Clonorchis sinensis]|uniref:Uncharacterized protein n=1 Tax=Clonorchis sinensis TaxID=79923 RepID=A0A419PTY3_CLOSI|nr:hypothetical protein CSKR_106210 [Clonorchis sinensis]